MWGGYCGKGLGSHMQAPEDERNKTARLNMLKFNAGAVTLDITGCRSLA